MATYLSSSIFLPNSPLLSPNPKFKKTLISASASPFRNGTPPPETDCPVPVEQQPVNEYQSLVSSLPFSWAASELSIYISRLAITGVCFAAFIGFPVVSFRNGGMGDPRADVIHLLIGATSAGLVAVTVVAVRTYLGWSYVGNRLLSATVEYEETGWYDGQIWVKTPEVLARDRLLGSFTVKPILNRVKLTLVGLAISLVVSILLYVNTDNPKDLTEKVNERVIAGVYNDESARSFEPDAFCGK